MKALKVVITILLSIVLVVVGFATQIGLIFNFTIIRPNFYKTTLLKSGVYESIRADIINQLKSNVDAQDEVIEEQYRDDIYLLIENALPKEEMEKQMGDFLGDAVDYFVNGNEQCEIPLHFWISNLEDEISKSSLQSEIEDFDHILDVTLINYLEGYSSSFRAGDSYKLKDVIYSMFAPNEKSAKKLDYFMFSFRYWITQLQSIIYIGLAIIAGLLVLLFAFNYTKIKVMLKISGIILLVNSLLLFAMSIAAYISVSIMSRYGMLSEQLLSYKDLIQNAIDPLGLIMIICGVLLLLIGVALLIVFHKKNTNNKSDSKVNTDKVDNEVIDDEISKLDNKNTK